MAGRPLHADEAARLEADVQMEKGVLQQHPVTVGIPLVIAAHQQVGLPLNLHLVGLLRGPGARVAAYLDANAGAVLHVWPAVVERIASQCDAEASRHLGRIGDAHAHGSLFLGRNCTLARRLLPVHRLYRHHGKAEGVNGVRMNR